MRSLGFALILVFLTSCFHSPVKETLPRFPSGFGTTKNGFVSLAAVDPKKQTVCSITLNSDNEIETFRRNLSKKDFQFVELVTEEADWLEKAVAAKVRCDVLVVSGHFGGNFFGENGQLELSALEDKSCESSAKGIFNAPKEVFLFGCNTLAGKTRDTRTPEQYQAVLMQDGFSATEAQRVASIRYSPLGTTFSDRMSNVFSGVPRIYGFDSIAPAGANVEDMLKNYLKGKNYATYLKSIDKATNNDLLKALRQTAITQTTGAKIAKDTVPRCYLNNKAIGESKKLDWIHSVLKDPKQRLSHLSEISAYLIQRKSTSPERGKNEAKINAIVNDKDLKKEMHEVFTTSLKQFPAVRLQLNSVGLYFGWIDFAEYRATSEDIFGNYFADGKITTAEKDVICSYDEAARPFITYDLVKNTEFSRELQGLYSCVNPTDPKIADHLAFNIYGKDREQDSRILNVFPSLNLKSRRIHEFLIGELETVQSDWDKLLLVYALKATGGVDDDIYKRYLKVYKSADPKSQISMLSAMAFVRPAAKQTTLPLLLEALQRSDDAMTSFRLYASISAFGTPDYETVTFFLDLLQKKPELGVDSLLSIYPDGATADPRIVKFIVADLLSSMPKFVTYDAGTVIAVFRLQSKETYEAMMFALKKEKDPELLALTTQMMGEIFPRSY